MGAHRIGARARLGVQGLSGLVRRVALVLAVLAAVLAAAPGAEAQNFRITNITVEGNRVIDAETIAGFARIPRTRAISAAELNAAYQRVVATGFFRSVDFRPAGNRLTIRVEEYPLLGRVAIEGNRRLRDEQLREVIRARPGGVYSPAVAEADANALAELYAREGRLGARITPRIIERPTGRVDLVYEVREGRVVELQRISFVGNRSFTERRLRNAIEASQAGRLSTLFRVDNYNEARIARDRQTLQDFYLSRGFIDAQVTAATTELTRQRDGAFVTFTIREGRQYRFGRVSVVSELPGVDAAPYQAALTNRTGELFTPNTLEGLIAQAEAVGTRAGERFLRAEPRLTRNERDGIIDVEFALVRGDRVFIERIDIQGNVTTEDQVIRRQFDVAEGDPLNPREIREAAARIQELGFFSDVRVNPAPGSAPDQAVVDVQVEETTTGSLGLGLSYGANDGIGASITYNEANFLGRGQALSLSLTTVRSGRSFDLSFTEPALLGRDLSFGLRLGRSSSTATSGANFGTTVTQIAPSLTFPLSEYGRLTLRAGLMRDQMTVADRPVRPEPTEENPDPETPPDRIPERLRAEADLGRVVTSSIGFTYGIDTRRNGPDPDRGFVFRFGTDLAGLGGDRRWWRSTVLIGYERRIMNGDVTLRAEFEAGVVSHSSGISRITERFALGSNQMRGFRPYGIGPVAYAADGTRQGLGGNVFAVARFDAEFPLGLPQEYNMAGGVFLDIGTLRGLDGSATVTSQAACPGGTLANCIIDSGSIRAAAGVSLFWRSPLGPLRFNFAVPVRHVRGIDRPQRFDLTLATRF